MRIGCWFMLFVLIVFLHSCKRQSALVIEPINLEDNQRFLTGENLDLRLYSIKNPFQYYQIDGYKALSAKNLTAKLDSFIKHRYPVIKNQHWELLTIWFYKKELYSHYTDIVYESARESENGSLIDHADDVVALVELEYERSDQKHLIRHTYLYYPKNDKPFSKHDTVSIE